MISLLRVLARPSRMQRCSHPANLMHLKNNRVTPSRPFASSSLRPVNAVMKALTYRANGTVAMSDRPKPIIQAPTDAIVKLTHTTICGTDLHILRGDVPTCEAGRILGHEGVGLVDVVGDSVPNLQPGDPVLISCISACATCEPCRQGMPSHCTTGGWILGNKIDGTQAEFVRVPHAASSLYKLPADVDPESAVLLSDIFPTGLECGVLNGLVQPGKTVAIVGAGPVGLAALVTAQLYSPSMVVLYDIDDARLGVGKRLGATHTVHANAENAVDSMKLLTDGNGYDTVIEAVGIPLTFEICQQLVAVGGRIANMGVHGTKVDLHLEKLWDRNISESFRSCPLYFWER
jgi:alcohol dehydrogenase